MSHAYYNELWLITRDDLEKLLHLDRKIQEEAPARKKETALNLALPTYLKYRNLVKRLVICYDQVVQKQKRDLIKRVLDCAIGRMLEYKREIVNLEFTDYQWPDDFMNQLKFTPDDIEIPIPASGRERLEERRQYIQELLDHANRPPPAVRERSLSQVHIESVTDVDEITSRQRAQRKKKTKTEEAAQAAISEEPAEEKAAREARLAAERTMQSAMLLIQSHERARVARSFAARAKRQYDYNRKLMTGDVQPKKVDKATYRSAAVKIQRAWRRYAARKALQRRIARVEEMLGMTIPSWKPREVFKKDEDNFRSRLKLMPSYAARVEKTMSEERTRLLRMTGPGLMEDITDEIREWFLIWYNEVGHFDVYPAANLGGSVLIATGQTLTPQEFLAEKQQKAKQAEKQTRDTKLDRADKKAEAKAKKGKGEAFEWKMPETQAFSLLESTNKDFIEKWSFREESKNSEEKDCLDLITDKLCYELQLEMREIVDELMRLELEKLNEALIKDRADDKEKLDIPMAKAKKKKGGKAKKRTKKGKRGALDDVAVEDLFNELVQAKIIKNYPVTSLKDWIGDLSYQNYEAAREYRPYKHRLGEIKQVVMEYCVLPLASKEVHQTAPLTRSVCICGLERSGKSFLANAICSEVGAFMFDMTPQVLVGSYLGKKNEQKLIEMISRVARVYAPSVIFIDGGERPWLKSVPPEERYYQPKRFARYYPKFVKSIRPGDQILFLTTSSAPYKATRPFVRIHDKFIIIPRTDYNTLYMYYKQLLMKYHGVDRNIDVSCLAKLSVGIPLEFIRECVERVLNLRRRITLKVRPLRPLEIMEEVMTYEGPTSKELNQFEKFESRTPLGRKRAKMLANEKAARQQLAAGKGKIEKTRG